MYKQTVCIYTDKVSQNHVIQKLSIKCHDCTNYTTGTNSNYSNVLIAYNPWVQVEKYSEETITLMVFYIFHQQVSVFTN